MKERIPTAGPTLGMHLTVVHVLREFGLPSASWVVDEHPEEVFPVWNLRARQVSNAEDCGS